MVNVEISLTSWHENIKHNTEQIGACCMSAVAPHNEWSAVDMKLHRDKPFRLLGCVLWYVISGSHILTVFLCVCGGLEIRLSCSQICPASRCWGKGESRSTLSSTRFKNTAKKSDRHWRPRHSTTQPSLDRRYCLCVCVCVRMGVKDRWEEIESQWWSDTCVFLYVCVSVLIKSAMFFCQSAPALFIKVFLLCPQFLIEVKNSRSSSVPPDWVKISRLQHTHTQPHTQWPTLFQNYDCSTDCLFKCFAPWCWKSHLNPLTCFLSWFSQRCHLRICCIIQRKWMFLLIDVIGSVICFSVVSKTLKIANYWLKNCG